MRMSASTVQSFFAFRRSIITAVAAITVASCAQPVQRTAAQDRQVYEAMARVEIEQTRTDAAEREKRRKAAEAYEASIDAGNAWKPQVHPVEPYRRFPATKGS